LLVWTVIVAVGICFLWDLGLIQEIRYGFIRGLIGYGVGVIAFYVIRFEVKPIVRILFSILFLGSFYLKNDNWSLVTIYISSSVIIPVLFDKKLNSRIPEIPWLKYLGLRSYSIYLNHNILLFLIPLAPKFWWFTLIVWIVYNEVVYRFVEMPRYLFKRSS
jgi:peptidoglycan/LPS O-acetylase OafA/YrhL